MWYVKASMKNNILSGLLVITLALSITACSPTKQSPTTAPGSSSMQASQPTAASTERIEDNQTNQQYSAGSLALTLVSPLDESETNLPQTELVGTVSEDVVLSINDEIYVLNAGNFSLQIPLEAGPNVLQIVVSDDSGNEVDVILTITYVTD